MRNAGGALLASLSRRGAVLSEPDSWQVWTPRDEPVPSTHPLGETCRVIRGEKPRLALPGAKWTPRMCLRSVSDAVSNNVARYHGRLMRRNGDCDTLVRLWRHSEPAATTEGRKLFLELGANIGVCTLTLLVRTNATLVVFEPNPANLWHLTRTLAWATEDNPTIRDRVAVYPIGAGNASASSWLYEDPGNGGNSVLDHPAEFTSVTSARQPLRVEVRALDEVLPSPGFADWVAAVKLDVQGYECRALDGSLRLLGNKSSLAMFVEVSPGHLAPNRCSPHLLGERLRRLGYATRFIRTHTTSNGGYYIAERYRFPGARYLGR